MPDAQAREALHGSAKAQDAFRNDEPERAAFPVTERTEARRQGLVQTERPSVCRARAGPACLGGAPRQLKWTPYSSNAQVRLDRHDRPAGGAQRGRRPDGRRAGRGIRTLRRRRTRAVAVLTGAGGTFCAGADLKAVATGRGNGLGSTPTCRCPARWARRGCCSRKPVIAAVEGHAVAGGLELALWCDLRVAATDAVFGVYCRRWGVPLIDGGTVRLPRLIGHSHALDLILTGRGVSGEEARTMGLANRLVEPGEALAAALELAHRSPPSRSSACAPTAPAPGPVMDQPVRRHTCGPRSPTASGHHPLQRDSTTSAARFAARPRTARPLRRRLTRLRRRISWLAPTGRVLRGRGFCRRRCAASISWLAPTDPTIDRDGGSGRRRAP